MDNQTEQATGPRMGQPSLAQAVIAGLIIICITLVGFIGNDFHTKQIQVMENQAEFRQEVGAAQAITNLRLRLIEEHLDEVVHNENEE